MGFVSVSPLRAEKRKTKSFSLASSADSISSGSSSSYRESMKLKDLAGGTKKIRLLYHGKKKSSTTFETTEPVPPLPKSVLSSIPRCPSPVTPPPRTSSRSVFIPQMRNCDSPEDLEDDVLDISSQFPMPPTPTTPLLPDRARSLDSARMSSPPVLPPISPLFEGDEEFSPYEEPPLYIVPGTPKSPASPNRRHSRRRMSRRRRAPTVIAIAEEEEDLPRSPTSRLSRISAYTWVGDHLEELDFAYVDGLDGFQINTKRDSVILPASALENLRKKALPTPPTPQASLRGPRPMRQPLPSPPSSPTPSMVSFRRVRPLPTLPPTPPTP